MYGKPYRVTIDDKLPIYQQEDKIETISMEQSEDHAWWPAIIEKAYAKMV